MSKILSKLLSHLLLDKCVFTLYAEIQMATKNSGKMFFGQSGLCRYPVGQKFLQNRLGRSASEINVFLHFMQEDHQKSLEIDFGEKITREDYVGILWVKIFIKIALTCTVSKISAFLCIQHSLISRPFCIGSFTKVNDFQTSI